MTWIKFETCTSDKPEVWQIAEILQIDPDAVVGKLLRVWTWFDQHTETGNAPSVTKTLLDRYLSVSGFCNAMVSVGWLTDNGSTITIPNFNRHNGETAKKRALTAKRVAEYKKSNAELTHEVTQELPKSNAANVTTALPRIEKNREDKNTNTIPPKSPKGERPGRAKYVFNETELPEQLRSPECVQAWQDWLQHRREIAKPVTVSSAKQALKWLAGIGPREAVLAIEYTIRKGWQGLVQCPSEDKPKQSFDDMVAEFHREPLDASY